MVTLTDIPEELIIIIIRKLDLYSIYSLYNACKQTRRIVQHGAVKIFNMSLNTMATVRSLKLNIFNDIASHLQELNMCCVQDLSKSSIMPTMKKLKQLKTLNVSYTSINIIDFIEIYKFCSTIKNISINFVFGKLGMTKITKKTVFQCRDVFENLDNVHFIGSMSNLLCSGLPFCILEKTKLNTLKYSIAETNFLYTTSLNEDIIINDSVFKCNFSYFHICLLNYVGKLLYYTNINTIPVLSELNLLKYEFIIIIIKDVDDIQVFISNVFSHFFNSYMNIKAECVTNFDMCLSGNDSIMIWNKETNKFDDLFFNKLFNTIKQYFPIKCTSDINVPLIYDWLYIVPKCDINTEINVKRPELNLNKRRRGVPNCVLNYDKIFKEKDRIQLSFINREHIKHVLTINTDFDYLKKVTYLNLSGAFHYNFEFFNVLFSCSCNLITLNVQDSAMISLSSFISRALPSSPCLKNLRLVDRCINFKMLFLSLSQCKTLENIYLIEDSIKENFDIPNPSDVIEKCKKLYNFYIEVKLKTKMYDKRAREYLSVKERFKRYSLNLNLRLLYIFNINDTNRYCYDPFIDVFNNNQIKSIK